MKKTPRSRSLLPNRPCTRYCMHGGARLKSRSIVRVEFRSVTSWQERQARTQDVSARAIERRTLDLRRRWSSSSFLRRPKTSASGAFRQLSSPVLCAPSSLVVTSRSHGRLRTGTPYADLETNLGLGNHAQQELRSK